MAENLGAIRYDVEVNTADTLKADAIVSKTTNNMVNDFRKVDVASKNLSTQMTKTSEGVKKGVHRNFGQAGIQVQQFVGQLQGGQSAMLALSQQSADLGIVLGAPLLGVFISLAAVLAGTLAPAIFGTVSNIEKLEKAVEQTKAVMTVGASGIAEYTEEMKRLNTASESLAKIKIALAMTANAEALKAAKKESSSLREELFGFQEYAEDAAKRLTGMAENAGGIVDIASAMRQFNAAASDEEKLKALQTTEDLLLSLRKDGVFPTKALADYAEKFFTFSDGVRQAITNNKALSESMDDISTSSQDVEDKFKSTTQALNTEIIALKSGEKAALKYSLMLGGMDANQVDAILTLYDKKVALENEAKAAKEAQEATEKYEESVHKSTLSNMDWLDSEIAKANKKDVQAKATLTTQVQSIGLTDEEEIKARYERELELLKAAEEEGIEIRGTYKERREQLALEEAEALKSIHTENNQFLEDAFGNLDTQIAGTMAQVVVGAKDGEEALRGLANTILTQVIGAVVQWGIAEVSKLFTVETAEKGIQAANAAATTASVSAQVGMNTALAAQNAFMATAAIPIVGPVLAPAAAAAAGAASAGLGASAIPLAPLAGAREFGGPVSAGSMYRVGEKGKPEFYKDNLGNLSMIPGENGEVIPANKMDGSGGGMTVNISNNTPYEVFVTQDQAANIANVQIGKEAGKLQKGRGNMYNAMKAGGKGYSNNAKR